MPLQSRVLELSVYLLIVLRIVIENAIERLMINHRISEHISN